MTDLDQPKIDFMKYLLYKGAYFERFEGEPAHEQLTAPYQGSPDNFVLLQSNLFPHCYDDSLQDRFICSLQISLNLWPCAIEFRLSIQRNGEICAEDITRYGYAEQADFRNRSQHNQFHLGRKRWISGVAQLDRHCTGPEAEFWDLSWNEIEIGSDTLNQENGLLDRHCAITPGSWVEDVLSEPCCCCL